MDFDANSISSLLEPFLPTHRFDSEQIGRVAAYTTLLLKWNARINLTAIREPEEIITRHFGEGFFAASHLFPDPAVETSVIDFGSGAGFPGIPIAIFCPRAGITLIESHNKKATFLKDVVRALGLTNVTVFSDRGEKFAGSADVVTLRGVEKFKTSASNAARLVSSSGRLGLLIGQEQVVIAKSLAALSGYHWSQPLRLPQSSSRVLLVGTKA